MEFFIGDKVFYRFDHVSGTLVSIGGHLEGPMQGIIKRDDGLGWHHQAYGRGCWQVGLIGLDLIESSKTSPAKRLVNAELDKLYAEL